MREFDGIESPLEFISKELVNSDWYGLDILKLDELILLAKEEADCSHDTNVRVAAIVFDDEGEVILQAHNCIPSMVEATDDRLSKEEKYYFTGHAEENVVSLAARKGIKLEGLNVLVTSRYPCAVCARMLTNAGIKLVLTPDMEVGTRWYESNIRAERIFIDSAVKVEVLDMLSSTFLKLDVEEV